MKKSLKSLPLGVKVILWGLGISLIANLSWDPNKGMEDFTSSDVPLDVKPIKWENEIRHVPRKNIPQAARYQREYSPHFDYDSAQIAERRLDKYIKANGVDIESQIEDAVQEMIDATEGH